MVIRFEKWSWPEYGFGEDCSNTELSELLSAYHMCAKANSPSFLKNSPSLPQNSVSSLFLSSETVPSKQYSACFLQKVFDCEVCGKLFRFLAAATVRGFQRGVFARGGMEISIIEVVRAPVATIHFAFFFCVARLSRGINFWRAGTTPVLEKTLRECWGK